MTGLLLQIQAGISIGRTNHNIKLGRMTAIIKMHSCRGLFILIAPATGILQRQAKLRASKRLRLGNSRHREWVNDRPREWVIDNYPCTYTAAAKKEQENNKPKHKRFTTFTTFWGHIETW